MLGPCKLLISKLLANGYTVYVFGQKDSHYQKYYTGNVKLIKLNCKRKYFSPISDFCDILKIIYHIIRIKPTYVHTFNPKPSLLGYLSVLFFPQTIFLIGVTGLGNTFIKAKFLLRPIKWFMSNAISRAKYVFFQNNDDYDLFITELGLSREKAMIFYSPGVDLEPYSHIRSEVSESQPLRVLLVARLIWQKGIDDFLEVCEEIKRLKADEIFAFTLIGERDYEHPDRLKDEDIVRLKASGICWIEWTDNIETQYYSNDVLLFMSRREGGPRAVLEASAAYMPTIGADVTGVNQLILDGHTGFLVEPHDVKSIIEKLQYYESNRKELIKHGVNARVEIAEKLSLENATAEQLKMYLV